MSNNSQDNHDREDKTIGRLSLIDVGSLQEARNKYGDSWKKRGGCGAFMNLARKWDRIEKAAADHDWDVFVAARRLPGDTGLLDDLRDLRRYLLLVECEVLHEKENRERREKRAAEAGISLDDPAPKRIGRRGKK